MNISRKKTILTVLNSSLHRKMILGLPFSQHQDGRNPWVETQGMSTVSSDNIIENYTWIGWLWVEKHGHWLSCAVCLLSQSMSLRVTWKPASQAVKRSCFYCSSDFPTPGVAAHIHMVLSLTNEGFLGTKFQKLPWMTLWFLLK